MQELINRAKELLANGTVARVLGWKKGDLSYNCEPAFFETAEDMENSVRQSGWFIRSLTLPYTLLSRLMYQKSGRTLCQSTRVSTIRSVATGMPLTMTATYMWWQNTMTRAKISIGTQIK